MRNNLTWLLGITFSALATSASAQNFSNTVFFGDSTTDSGWFLYKPLLAGPGAGAPPAGFGTGLAPPGAGTWTTNPDPGWAQVLASKFGYAATPADTPGTGGNNWAIGGARVVAEYHNTWSSQHQLTAYLASTGGVADPNALYTYWIGSNDLKTTTKPLGPSPGNIVNPQNVAQLTAVAGQTVAQISTLSAAGARYILVPGAQSLTPESAAAAGVAYDPVVVASRSIYNQTVWNGLAANGVRFIPADISAVSNYVLVNPAPFGITHTSMFTTACGIVNAFQCTPANWVAPNANKTYFYADGPAAPDGGVHTTGAVQQIVADYVYSLVVAPSQISFLAEAPLKTRQGVISAINNQIPLSYGTPGAFHGWASGDVSWLKMTNNAAGFPDDPGTPLMTTAGFDYAITSNWLVGAAFSGLTTKQSFSLGGNYKQDEFAVSLYTAYRHGSFWTDAIVSWGALRDTVNRQIPLGITQQSNQGSTTGTNISFAGEIGYDFTHSFGDTPAATRLSYKAPARPAALELTHGPVAGVILQQVYLNGFTESNASGAPTALSFGSQTRNSAVSELGYQSSLKYGIWQPYAKVVWNHEWADLNRRVTASLTSVVAPSYAMPAVVLGRDWASATIGTRVRLGEGLSGYAAFISAIGQNNVTTYGGQLGLNLALNPAAVSARY
ncbi:autotransporter outer membrane beta-barrel domain-containing protein [Bradyrhizobium sp. Pha-3]|uniref:autotransporter outer membrane beta-barrel domain-containing protein n=1 Tax=Bradyrhizobium sp. Pha-3 TaxID=208375 RepID=UPI0035D4B176